MDLTFRSLSDDRIGAAWKAVFDHGWTGWKEWYMPRRDDDLIPLEVCRRMMRRHMPGLERSWDTWVNAVDGDDDVARFLSFWSPPRYLVNCSQVAFVDRDGPVLVRNYDLDPKLNEATLLKTGWHGFDVIGMVEGMAGLSDGMNRAGLALSLTFGGRTECRTGFGIPLIMRYVLETCRDVRDAIAAFRAIPSHMSYNITMIDRAGAAVTLMLSPDRPMIVRPEPWATNHQLGVEWPRHGRLSQTLERGAHLKALVDLGGMSVDAVVGQFLAPPLHTRGYDRGFGTVYTAVYRPGMGTASLAWGDGARHVWSFDDFPARSLDVSYSSDGSWATPTKASHLAQDEDARFEAIKARNTYEKLHRWSNLNSMVANQHDTGDPA